MQIEAFVVLNVPWGQTLQPVHPASENVSALQGKQVVAPEYVPNEPGGQLMQMDAPEVLEKVPRGHGIHDVPPDTLLYRPATQLVQDAEDDDEIEPTGQGVHDCEENAPMKGLYVPGPVWFGCGMRVGELGRVVGRALVFWAGGAPNLLHATHEANGRE